MFELTEEQKMIKTNAHKFLLKEIDPIVDEREKRAAKGEHFTKEDICWFKNKLASVGYGESIEYGSNGFNLVSFGVLREELGYFWVSLCFAGAGPGYASGDGILNRMTPECRQKYEYRIKDMIGCAGISESNQGGSAMPRMCEFKSVLNGDYWICNGTKTWTGNGDIADYITCLTLIDRGKGVEGIGNIFIDRHESPYETREMHKLGWWCHSFTETSFSDCKVPKENMLLGGGMQQTTVGFAMERTRIAALATGLSQACVDASVKYARETKRFGKPIAAFQLIQNMLVNMAVETDCSRYLYLRAFDLQDQVDQLIKGGELVLGDGAPRVSEIRKTSSMAKFFCCDAANRTAYNAVSIHGAAGVIDDLRIERYYRDARLLNLAEGTSEIQRLIIGRELTGISAIR